MPFILSETRDLVTTITLNRPEKLNAFAETMREDLVAALRAAEGRVVVITGAGRAFCAGGDVEIMAALQKNNDGPAFRRLLDAGREVVLQIVTMEKPVIASVNGIAAGAGCNLALACDYRMASGEAKFAQSFVRIGLNPDWGGTWLLPRIVGRSAAFEMMTTGRVVDTAEALGLGLVDRVSDSLADATQTLAREIASAPPATIAAIKRLLTASEHDSLATQIDLESNSQVRAFSSKEAAERVSAFLEKRTPKF